MERDIRKQLEYVLTLLGKCTDEYMYIFDLQNDYYAISETAKDVFNFTETRFENASEEFKKIIYPEDYDKVMEDLEKAFDTILPEKSNFEI